MERGERRIECVCGCVCVRVEAFFMIEFGILSVIPVGRGLFVIGTLSMNTNITP